MKPAAGPQAVSSGGFSLVEVTLALGIAAFCLLAIVGVMNVGLTSSRDTMELTAAAGIASSIASDLAATPLTAAKSQGFGLAFPASAAGTAATVAPQTIFFSEGGVPTGVAGASATDAARYRASVGIVPPPADQRSATIVRILVTWPAAADPNPNAWPEKENGSFEILTALNRN